MYLVSLTVLKSNAEFGIDLSRLYKIMGMSINTGLDTEENTLINVFFICNAIQKLKLIFVIYHDVTDTAIQCKLDLVGRFIIAVEEYLFHREACLVECVKLTARNNVGSKPFFCNESSGIHCTKCLACKENETVSVVIGVNGIFICTAIVTHQILVQYVERGAEFLCKLHGIVLTDDKMIF